MARRTTKKKDLTPEEKLAQALVPVSEQPYQVPENWCWVRLGCVSSTQYGYTAKAIYNNNYPKMLRITDIQDSGVDWSSVPNCVIESDDLEKYLLVDGDIVIARTGATTGKSYMLLSSPNSVFASYLIRLRIQNAINVVLVYYYLQSDLYWRQISVLSTGIAQPGVNSNKLQKMVIPLPPLPEQQRIVARIESLFAKLDEAKEKAQAVVDGFEERKAAILHKAFTGELTKKWREERGIDESLSWKYCALGEFASSQYGYTEKATNDIIGPRFLRITDIQDGKVLWEDVPFCKIDDGQKKKYALNKGDIVIARIGATTGKSYMVVDEVDAVYASYLIRVSIHQKESLRSIFLYYFLQCPSYWRQITELSSGIAQPGVNGNKLKTLQLPIPSIFEQDAIVEILSHLLPIEQQARDAADAVLDQIDTMKKAILARAFRGELGTNHPKEESAVELVKSIVDEV